MRFYHQNAQKFQCTNKLGEYYNIGKYLIKSILHFDQKLLNLHIGKEHVDGDVYENITKI